jgi:hypothetical protein
MKVFEVKMVFNSEVLMMADKKSPGAVACSGTF